MNAGFDQEFFYFDEILCIEHLAPSLDHPKGLIRVKTRLDSGQIIQDLPAEYDGVPVRQEPLGGAIRLWCDTWASVLKFLFNLDESALRRVFLLQDHVFSSPWFLHDGPFDDLPTPLLARYALGHSSDLNMREIGEEIFRAFAGERWPDRDWHPQLDESFDWEAARTRAFAVINVYREKLGLSTLSVP